MRAIYLGFHHTLNKTVCGFTNEDECMRFVRYMINRRVTIERLGRTWNTTAWDELPTSDPASKPIHVFDTAREALQWFSVLPDRYTSEVPGVALPVWEGL